ncbi:MAG: [Fe-Fe] hydrogenase large subunit C-terminal domain-containing protein [Bacteroidales bacterium]
MSENFFYHALKIDHKICYGCTLCMRNCPTEAIRVRNGKATIYGNKCVDCGECYKVCPCGAVYVAQDDFDNIYNFKYRVVLMPSVFLGQFPEDIRASQVYSVIKEIGFTHVIEVEASTMTHTKLTNQYIYEHQDKKPLISTFCPAVVRLIQVKFPSLVDNLIPIKAPVDFTSIYIRKKLIDEGIDPKDIGVFYITPCAAKIAATKSPVGEDKSTVDGVLNMDTMYNMVLKQIKQHKEYDKSVSANDASSDSILFALTNGEKRLTDCKKSFAIDEIHNVMDFLEKVENDEIDDLDFLELRACDESCAGGILTCGNRFLINDRMTQRARKLADRERNGETSRRKEIYSEEKFLIDNSSVAKIMPRSMMVLDEDISIAFEKLTKIKEIEAMLPQTDCNVCGAPSCHALAEDIACDEAKMSDCVFMQRNLEMRNSLNVEESVEIMKKIWGEEKIKDYVLKK